MTLSVKAVPYSLNRACMRLAACCVVSYPQCRDSNVERIFMPSSVGGSSTLAAMQSGHVGQRYVRSTDCQLYHALL
jgi:hypothetical protein